MKSKTIFAGFLMFAMMAGLANANLAISANQIVSGQPVTINAECQAGTTCTILRDGVVIATLVGDSYGTIHYTDYPPLGAHDYEWTGQVYGFSGTLIDKASVTVVKNDADTLQGHSYNNILTTIKTGDQQTLEQSILYTNLKVGQEAFQRMIGDWVLNTKINQVEADSISRDNQLQANIDAEADARIAGDNNLQNQINGIQAGLVGIDARFVALEKRTTKIESDLYTTKPTYTFDQYCGVYYKPLPATQYEESQLSAPISNIVILKDAVDRVSAGKASGLTVENCITVPKEILDPQDQYGRSLTACVAEALDQNELVKFPCVVNQTIGSNPDHYIIATKNATDRTVWTRVDVGTWAGVLMPDTALTNTPLVPMNVTCKRVGTRMVC